MDEGVVHFPAGARSFCTLQCCRSSGRAQADFRVAKHTSALHCMRQLPHSALCMARCGWRSAAVRACVCCLGRRSRACWRSCSTCRTVWSRSTLL